jgi:hypothetical protein
MKRVNIAASHTDQFGGKWVVINPKGDKIIAVGDSLDDVSPLVVHTLQKGKKEPPIEGYAYRVPKKDEGPFIL